MMFLEDWLLLMEFFIGTFFALSFVALAIKFYRQRMPSHFWGAIGFLILLLQQTAFSNWILLYGHTIPLSVPLHLQGLIIFLCLNLIGLAITGKVREEKPFCCAVKDAIKKTNKRS